MAQVAAPPKEMAQNVSNSNQKPSNDLIDQLQIHLALFAAGTIAMYGLVANDPSLKQPIGDRGEAELGYLFIGGLFWVASFFFLLARLGAGTEEKKSVALTMVLLNAMPAITYSFVIPNRLGLTFQDLNGNPLDIAPHWEAIMATPLLCHVIGTVTRNRELGYKSQFWNYLVFIFGILSSELKCRSSRNGHNYRTNVSFDALVGNWRLCSPIKVLRHHV
jgi:hypothetical protein